MRLRPIAENVRLFVSNLDPALLRRMLWVLVIGYAAYIAWRHSPVPAGSDSGGYFNAAKLISQGRLSTPARVVPELGADNLLLYVPLGFNHDDLRASMVPNYPIGLPLHYAVFSLVFGWNWGPTLVAILAALGTVFCCYGLLRELDVSKPLSVAGAAALGISPMLLYMAFLPMSDNLAMAWWTASLLAGLKARHQAGWAVASGCAFAIAVLVRPSNLVLAPALFVLLGHWKRWMGAIVGGLPGALLFAWYNHVQFGNALTTGYGSIFDVFAAKHVGPSWQNYLSTFWHVLPVSILALLFAPFMPWKSRALEIVALFVATFGLLVFYSYYDMTSQVWWYVRFVLPVFPCLVALAMVAAQGWTLRAGKAGEGVRQWGAVLVILAVSLATSVHWVKARHIFNLKLDLLPYQHGGEWARDNLPKDAVVLCMQVSSTLYYYTEVPVLRWDMMDVERANALVKTLEQTRRPFYAMVYPFEREPALKERFPGRWTHLVTFRDLEVWRMDWPE